LNRLDTPAGQATILQDGVGYAVLQIIIVGVLIKVLRLVFRGQITIS